MQRVTDSKRWKWAQWIVFVTFVVLLGLLTWILVWSFRPYNDLWIETDGTMVAESRNAGGMPILRPGDDIILPVEFCNEDVDVVSERWLESPRFSVYSSGDDYTPVGAVSIPGEQFLPPEAQCGEIDARIRIPGYIRPGIYRLRNDNVYEANPLRSVTVTYYSEWFEVIE